MNHVRTRKVAIRKNGHFGFPASLGPGRRTLDLPYLYTETAEQSFGDSFSDPRAMTAKTSFVEKFPQEFAARIIAVLLFCSVLGRSCW